MCMLKGDDKRKILAALRKQNMHARFSVKLIWIYYHLIFMEANMHACIIVRAIWSFDALFQIWHDLYKRIKLKKACLTKKGFCVNWFEYIFT